MVKKIICIVLAAAFLTALLSCGKKDGADETSANDTTEAESSASPSVTDRDAANHPIGDTSVTEPQATEPAVTEPPVTEPPVTEPPVTEPPVTEPPVTEPPVTEPPVTEPSTGTETDAPIEIKTLKYTALGDSICEGYGLASPESERYSSVIESYLDLLLYYECDCFNYGVSGQTSSELLTMLNDEGKVAELANSDIVTVSIGANNVLGPAISTLTQYMLNAQIEDEASRQAANALIYSRFVALTNAGIKQFEQDLPKIIDKINDYAPDAQIIFQTIYNPYKNISLSLDFSSGTIDMNGTTEELVTRLNEIIKGNARKLGYDVADIYAAFKTEMGCVNADGFGGDILTGLDPHPTAKGHKLIADTICSLIYTE